MIFLSLTLLFDKFQLDSLQSFKALAMEKPLLLGVDGEARNHFITKAQAGLFFEPENANELAKQVRLLSENPEMIVKMGKNARKYVGEFFNRDILAQSFQKQLNDL
jgi:glycosyltransferase involved in cell wall biosynthesis